ncbi:MAG: FHA domain-containing protein [Deltaproteobacteria bacterium]|nr:FHA domain-containing protein [Deltaproteobacteria bacterium]
MARCVLCTMPASTGVLCDAHRKSIAASSLTPEQIASRRATGTAGLIDPWGVVWAIGDPTVIGRALQDCDFTLLHASVSSVHARIERAGEGWRVIDQGSRNGTCVDNVRVEAAPLVEGARLRFGEVDLLFVDRSLPGVAVPSGPGRTAPSRKDRLVFAASLTATSGERIELTQRVEGGIVKLGTARVELARLEFHLLQLLTEARREAATADLAYLPWAQVAEKLEFRSYEASSENVRELVRRVRRKLQQHGIPDLIESRHGLGYRLAGDYEAT